MRSEQNKPVVEREVLKAARAILGRRNLVAIFEHGHWWVEHTTTGAQWDAVDVAGGPYPFDFEQVSAGSEGDL
jgi:hypothetical protein